MSWSSLNPSKAFIEPLCLCAPGSWRSAVPITEHLYTLNICWEKTGRKEKAEGKDDGRVWGKRWENTHIHIGLREKRVQQEKCVLLGFYYNNEIPKAVYLIKKGGLFWLLVLQVFCPRLGIPWIWLLVTAFVAGKESFKVAQDEECAFFFILPCKATRIQSCFC